MEFDVAITPASSQIDISTIVDVTDVSVDVLVDDTAIPVSVEINDTNLMIDVIIDGSTMPVDVSIGGTDLSISVIEAGTELNVDVLLGNGGDKYYRHSQDVSSSLWTVHHNLDKNPSVTVTDSAGTTVEGLTAYTDSNNLKIYFSAPFSGFAELN